MAYAPAALAVGAARLALPYGLFSVVSVAEASAERWQNGVEWEQDTCEPAGGYGLPDCDPATPTPGFPKALDANGPGVGEATPFGVFGHFTCSPAGWNFDVAQARATDHLLQREEARVEHALWTGDLGNTPNFTTAVKLALGTGARQFSGLAELERRLASDYGSLGVIHMDRGTALAGFAVHVLHHAGTRLETVLGTPVVAGAGYDGSDPTTPGDDPVPGQPWVVGTPAIFGYRSDVFTSSNRPGDLLDRSTNDLYAIAERTYLLGWDQCWDGGAYAAQLDFT